MADRFDVNDAHFSIACLGMADAGMCSFDADDGVWAVEHGEPGSRLIPFRRDSGPPATLREVLLIADCISFDHDMPTVVRPIRRFSAANRPPIEPIGTPIQGVPGAPWYFDALETALGIASGMRVDGAVDLRYALEPELASFALRFGDAGEALSLYAMATRQVDWMSEFLCLYRVIEWARKDNGKAFIVERLETIATHDFGGLRGWPEIEGPRFDVFEEHRARACIRISAMRDEGLSSEKIADHLYGVRNALAHGKSNFLLADFADDVVKVARELSLVKLLARMAVGAPTEPPS